jgi:hypothetical protein
MKIATDNMKGMKNYALERLSENYAKKPLLIVVRRYFKRSEARQNLIDY